MTIGVMAIVRHARAPATIRVVIDIPVVLRITAEAICTVAVVPREEAMVVVLLAMEEAMVAVLGEGAMAVVLWEEVTVAVLEVLWALEVTEQTSE